MDLLWPRLLRLLVSCNLVRSQGSSFFRQKYCENCELLDFKQRAIFERTVFMEDRSVLKAPSPIDAEAESTKKEEESELVIERLHPKQD